MKFREWQQLKRNEIVNKKIGVYVRVSSKEQLRGHSIDGQESDILKYIEYYDIQGDVTVYRDEGRSAKTLKRKELKKMIAAINAGEINTVIVYKLDRLVRRVRDWITFLDLIEDGLELISIEESINTSTAKGRNRIYDIVADAELEEDRISERTIDGLRFGAEKGRYIKGRVPLGYKRIDGQLYVDENEKADVLKLFEMAYNGMSMNMIYSIIKNQPYSQRGLNFCYSMLTRLLFDKSYIGIMTFQGVEYANIIPPIMTKEYFDEVHRRLDYRHKDTKHIYAYKSVIRCIHCDSDIVLESAYNAQKSVYLYYKCSTCKTRINERKIDDYIFDFVLYDMIMSKKQKYQESLSAEIKSIELAKDHMYNMYIRHEISIDTYMASMLKFEKDINENKKLFSKGDSSAIDLIKYSSKKKDFIDKYIQEIIIYFKLQCIIKVVLKRVNK